MKTIKELMEWRFACKQFDEQKKIPENVLKDILETARLSPSAYGLQAWKFIVVTDAEVKAQLAPVCYNQPQITQSAALIVCCIRTDVMGENGVVEKYSNLSGREQNKSEEEVAKFKERLNGTMKMMGDDGVKVWLQKQIYIPAESMILAAAEQGIDSCPMEGFEAAGVAKVLELPEYLIPTILVPLGYRNMEQPKKIRFGMDEVVEWR